MHLAYGRHSVTVVMVAWLLSVAAAFLFLAQIQKALKDLT